MSCSKCLFKNHHKIKRHTAFFIGMETRLAYSDIDSVLEKFWFCCCFCLEPKFIAFPPLVYLSKVRIHSDSFFFFFFTSHTYLLAFPAEFWILHSNLEAQTCVCSCPSPDTSLLRVYFVSGDQVLSSVHSAICRTRFWHVQVAAAEPRPLSRQPKRLVWMLNVCSLPFSFVSSFSVDKMSVGCKTTLNLHQLSS